MKYVKSIYFWILLSPMIWLPIGYALDWPITSKIRQIRCERAYSYINPDVVCGSPDVIKKVGYAETRSNIEDYIAEETTKGHLTSASLYFRDLAHGPVFGIDELEPFAPASLLKLPLAFVFLFASENQPALLQKKVRYEGLSTTDAQRVKPRESATPGTPYEIQELLRMMIQFSDNASYEALDAFISAEPNREMLRRETFQEIGLIDPKDRVEETITVRGYSSLFRILYNASYLDDRDSELLLSWLAASDYGRGLAAGVPQGTTVAHKFGERYFPDGRKQLHDCGIVYFPRNPYLLCVMTKGDDWTALENVIATISRMVYEEVDSRRI